MSTDHSQPERRDLDAQGNILSSAEENQRHPWESRLNGDELASMPYLDAGTRLQRGQSYLDLNQLNGGPFTPTDGQSVRNGDRIVAQRDLDPVVWRKLVGEG